MKHYLQSDTNYINRRTSLVIRSLAIIGYHETKISIILIINHGQSQILMELRIAVKSIANTEKG